MSTTMPPIPTPISYTCEDYFLARVPDFTTILPSYPIPVAIQAALSLYWDRFIPQSSGLWVPSAGNANVFVPPAIDESLITERQKVLGALRAVLGAIPVFTQALTTPKVVDAKGGPAEAKFEELSKLLKVLMPQWQTELKNLEAFEGIFFDLLPNIPGFMQTLDDCSIEDANWIYDPSRGIWELTEV